MLYHLLYPPLNVVQYITFRTAVAGLTAFVISLLVGPWLIRTLRGFQIGQVVRDDLTNHQSKAGTPTTSPSSSHARLWRVNSRRPVGSSTSSRWRR